MPRAKKHSAEEIIPKLRAAELEIAKGGTAAEAAKKIGVTEQTYYRWRKEYGGLRTDQAKRLKELEKENVVCLPPALDEYLRFEQGVEDFTVQQLVTELAVERFNVAVLPG